jgi:hypothetical protein
MLGANFRVHGIGYVYVPGSNYGHYWTNDFGGYVVPGATPPPPAPTVTPTPSPSPVPTPSPSPTPTPEPGCSGDLDCDGWTNTREAFVGTGNSVPCSATRTANDESPDSLPPDFNDDRRVDIGDLSSFSSRYNKVQGQTGYAARWDLNADGQIGLFDVALMSSPFNTSC